MEVWKDMVVRDRKGVLTQGVTEKYMISSFGRVWNKKDNCYVSHVLTGKPQYWYVNLYLLDGNRILRRVHNIMGHTFLGVPEDLKMTIDHIDRNKYNNALYNIRWASRKVQSQNRDAVNTLSCGTALCEFSPTLDVSDSIVHKLFKEGYADKDSLSHVADCYKIYGSKWDWDIQCKHNTHKLRDLVEYFNLDFTTTKSLLDKSYNIVDIVKGTLLPLPPEDLSKGYELQGCWFPTLQSICDLGYSNCCLYVLRERVKEMSIEEAVNYNSTLERYGFEYQGIRDTLAGHCDRLGLSHDRVLTVKIKYNLTNEAALKTPVKRIIKHCVNGEIRRNRAWYKEFNIPAKQANSYLNRTGTKRTFRDVLEHYNVDTSNMTIFPCDGEVVMINNPL